MSTADASSENPYTAPATLPPEPAMYAGQNHLEYSRSISYVFENPNWLVNLLFVAICMLAAGIIPILPQMVLLGYQFEIIEALLVRPSERYPDFNFNRLLHFLMRGLWPFLVALICSIVAIPVVLMGIGIPLGIMGALIAAVGEDGAPIVVLVMLPLIICIALLTAFLINLVIIPMILRAGLAQDFGTAFNFAFIKDFARKMWKDMLLAGLFLIVVALAAEVLGILLCFVGIFFTIAVVQLAQAHIGMQLYRIYLSRGGEKIPLKPVEAVSK